MKCRGHNLTYVLFLLKIHNLKFNSQETSDKMKSRGHCSSTGKRICPQCGRLGFDPWVGKICWGRASLSTPVFWLGEFWVAESDKTERLSLSAKKTWFVLNVNEMKNKVRLRNSIQIKGLKRHVNWMQCIFLEIKCLHNWQSINKVFRLNKTFNFDFIIIPWLGKRRSQFSENA